MRCPRPKLIFVYSRSKRQCFEHAIVCFVAGTLIATESQVTVSVKTCPQKVKTGTETKTKQNWIKNLSKLPCQEEILDMATLFFGNTTSVGAGSNTLAQKNRDIFLLYKNIVCFFHSDDQKIKVKYYQR